MGGKSKSSSSSNVDNSSFVVDNSGNTGTAVTSGDNSTVTVTMTDQGAVNSAFQFGAEALAVVDAGSERVTETSLEAMTQVRNLADMQTQANLQTLKQVGQLAESFRSDGASRDQANQRLLIIGGMTIAGALVLLVFLKGDSKK